MNIDDTLKDNLNKIQKKVSQEFEIVSKHGNCYKIKSYKWSKNYAYEIYRQNNITGKFEYLRGCSYFSTKENLWKGLESNVFYYYDL